MSNSKRVLMALAALLGLALTSCGGGYGSGDNAGSSGGSGSGGDTIMMNDTDLGKVLADGDGNTLYLYTEDSPGKSACTDDQCVSAWPPLKGKPKAGDGVDAALIGTITRDDGTEQATYNDHPLYYNAADSGPGDTSGQEMLDKWYVLDAQGNKVEGEGSGESEDSGDGGGGY